MRISAIFLLCFNFIWITYARQPSGDYASNYNETCTTCKSGSVVMTWSGPWASNIRGDVRYSKCDFSVTLELPEVRGSASISDNIYMLSTLPIFLRPDQYTSFFLRVRDSAVDVVGSGLLGFDGTFFVGTGMDIEAFTGIYNTGFYRQTLSYLAA